MVNITVEGYAVRHRQAERGTAYVRISAESKEEGSPIARVERSYAAIMQRAKESVSSGVATWWGAEPVVAWSGYEWQKPKPHLDGVKVRMFYAAGGVRVKFRNFSALAAFSKEMASYPEAGMVSVQWTLTEAQLGALVDETRVAAAQDARRRATTYAKALGLADVALVHLYEQGLRPHTGASYEHQSGVGVRNGVAASGGTGEASLRAEEIEITAVVTGDFTTI